jgi:hypothetical protein
MYVNVCNIDGRINKISKSVQKETRHTMFTYRQNLCNFLHFYLLFDINASQRHICDNELVQVCEKLPVCNCKECNRK